MPSLQKIKLDELKDMGLDDHLVDEMDLAEVIRLLQRLKRGIPNNPTLKHHTLDSLTELNEDTGRACLKDVLSIANRLGEPVVSR